MDSTLAHHHFHPLLTTVKPKLQPNHEKPTKCKKNKESSKQCMEVHNSIRRGSWTHV
jgi:hypothetical protein